MTVGFLMNGSRRLGIGLRSLRSNSPLTLFAIGVTGLWVIIAALAPIVAPYDPLKLSADLLASPSTSHLLGTDEIGRDVLSRIIWGARVSIPYSILIVAASLAVGTVIGGVAGYFGGWIDGIIMRSTDLVFAFPGIILAMAIAAALGANLKNAVIAIVLVAWPNYARVSRSLVITAMHSDFVRSAQLLGASSLRAMARDVLPNVLGPMAVYSTLGLGDAMLALAGLSFLGLGSQPPTAEWGSMIAEGAQNFEFWWIALFPGLAIISVVLALNILGDRFRDALDPRLIR